MSQSCLCMSQALQPVCVKAVCIHSWRSEIRSLRQTALLLAIATADPASTSFRTLLTSSNTQKCTRHEQLCPVASRPNLTSFPVTRKLRTLHSPHVTIQTFIHTKATTSSACSYWAELDRIAGGRVLFEGATRKSASSLLHITAKLLRR